MQAAGFTPERFANIDLYVTIEPCVMCAAALLLIGTFEDGIGPFVVDGPRYSQSVLRRR